MLITEKSNRIKQLIMMRLKIIPMLLAVMAFMAASCSSAEKEEVDSGKIIIGHVTDSHTWHILDYKSSDGTEHPVAINLPIILIDDGPGGWWIGEGGDCLCGGRWR